MRRSAPGARRGPRRPSPTARAAAPGAPERLQKVLARAGLASRREAEAWIRSGRLTINGVPATLGARVSASDRVELDGRAVRARAQGAPRVFLCHRSPGEPLRTPDAAESAADGARSALLERLPRRAGRRFMSVSPMPRIDGGLELVTSDGTLALTLQRAVRQLPSEFSVRVRGELSQEQLAGVASGLLDRGTTLGIERCEAAGGEGANRWYSLAARGASGKDVRQLFERQGALVSRVLRTRFGPLALERTLGRGQFREVTAQELAALTAQEAGAAG
jgi:23S rRNA pseudouridine2605 synthase